ncbi:K(lysine) acetyltransferase [Tieghemiomyces parasiticus]|uniref:histone acetyltransferase n=1 Tax=Tieghemiomyces parasiticus TaxID=78921 RepID=A0A9W8A7I5_9FUNG|nr:K(lysine) acetyltransferase [Tieghemiomyces parasiticus]
MATSRTLATPVASPASSEPPAPRKVQFENYSLTTWYSTGFPKEHGDPPVTYVCWRCFKYFKESAAHDEHLVHCAVGRPPGAEIYREGRLRIYEIDGRQSKRYCQNLCLFGKLFLDNKTVFYDIDRFSFYVLARVDIFEAVTTHHVTGFFSKGHGYGRLLIELSYHLTRLDRKVGTPERPLSAQARTTFERCWQRLVLTALRASIQGYVALTDLAQTTGMVEEDVLVALDDLGLMEHWHSRHVLCVTSDNLTTAEARFRGNLQARFDPAAYRGPPSPTDASEH